MLIAAAVCPSPPLLVPAVGLGLGEDIDALRAQCAAAVAAVRDAAPDLVFVVGADLGPRATSFAPWAAGAPGADARVDVPEPLPLSVLVGAHLTRGSNRSFVVVDPSLTAAECLALGADLAGAADRVGLVLMGDGSARHDLKAPGYLDPRAGPWDDAVHEAFAAADADALAGLDPDLAHDLLAAGRPAWQVLAGAARGWQPERRDARLHVPFGVGYHVVTWS